MRAGLPRKIHPGSGAKADTSISLRVRTLVIQLLDGHIVVTPKAESSAHIDVRRLRNPQSVVPQESVYLGK